MTELGTPIILYLFQNRYKSILCQEDTYLLELVRYIHLNPLRAKLVPDPRRLNTYPYCGHGVLLGKHKNGFQETKTVLKQFGKTIETARTLYRAYVKKGIARGRRADLSGGGLVRSAGGWSAVKMQCKSELFQKADQRILGDRDFVEGVLRHIDERLESTYALRTQGYDFDKTVQRLARLLDMPAAKVTSAGKRRPVVKAPGIACYWAHRKLGMSQTELARKFKVSQPAVCAAVQNGQKMLQEHQFKLVEDNL